MPPEGITMAHRSSTRHRRWLSAAALPIALAALVSCSGGAGDYATEEGDSGLAEQSKQVTDSSRDEAERTAAKPVDPQLLTYTATLDVRVADTRKGTSAAERLVERAGGYVEHQRQRGESSTAQATTTFQVPTAKYRQVLDGLTKLGTRTGLTQRTENVTEAVADVDQRVRSARTSLDRLRTLLKTATSVKDVLAIEAQLSSRQAELESLLARQRALAKQVDYATITLELTGPRDERDEEATGFVAGLRAGWQGLLALLTGAATAAGAALPFLLLAGPLGLVGWLLWRRHRRTRARPAAAEPSA